MSLDQLPVSQFAFFLSVFCIHINHSHDMISDLPVEWISSLSEVKQLAVRLEELRCQRWAEEARYVYLAGLGIPSLNRHGKSNSLI